MPAENATLRIEEIPGMVQISAMINMSRYQKDVLTISISTHRRDTSKECAVIILDSDLRILIQMLTTFLKEERPNE
jgi:hypothetical protein